jgi:hypothetical protein
MTHVQNLPSIIRTGCLYCDKQAQAHQARSTAYTNLKAKRAAKLVPVPPNGVIADYVPFYFAPRSPMLYAVHTGYVGTGLVQSEIVYLVTTVDTIVQAGKSFVFTDRHPLSSSPRFCNNLNQLNHHVDWQVMQLLYWNDTPECPDRKSRRQAEFLVYQMVEWTLIEQIGVFNRERLAQVSKVLASAAHQPPVQVRRDWYY